MIADAEQFTDAELSEMVRGYVYAATWTDLERPPECPECGESVVVQESDSYPWTCANHACAEEGTHFAQDDFGSQETGSDPYEYGPDDLTADAMLKVRAYVSAFMVANIADLRAYVESDEIRDHVECHREGGVWDRAGDDLYLSQAGHGVSWRDRFHYRYMPDYVERLEASSGAAPFRERGGHFYLIDGEIEVDAS